MKSKFTLILLTGMIILSGIYNHVLATKHIIQVSNFSFTPSSLPNVTLGDTIRWQWVSGFHTTTSTTIPAGAQSWDALISSSNTFYEYKPAVAGTFHYKCTPHASMGMTGSFVVTGVVQLPDLVIQNPLANPISVSAGSTTLTSCNVSNTGSGAAGSSTLRYYLSSNSSYDITDVLLGSVAVGSIPAGSSSLQSLSVTIPANIPSGNWYLLFYADAANGVSESNENNNTELVQLTIVPQGNSLAGIVAYENISSSPIPNVTVSLRNSQNVIIATSVTNGNGFYSFTGIPDGSYTINATTTTPWGGVNADDALTALRHFVGISYLSGLKLIAANVDGNSFVNSLDALAIARRFVGLVNSFPAGDWYLQSPVVSLVGDGSLTQNIKAICMGDCNGSNPGNSLKPSPSITQSHSNTQMVRPAQQLLIPVKMNQYVSLGSLSLVLHYPQQSVEIQKIIASGNCNNMIYNILPGEIRIAAYSLVPMEINRNEALIWIDARILKDVPEGKEISLALDENSALGDVDGNTFESIDFSLPQLKVTTGAVKHIITQVNMSFSPQALTGVLAGDTIEWVWTSGFHTTTSGNIPNGATAWDAVLSSSSPTYTYLPLKEGTYNYVCTPHASFGMTGSFTVSGSVGIPETGSLISDISISPNPVRDVCRISFSSEINSAVQLKVFNLTGQEVMNEFVDPNRGNHEILVDFSSLKPGCYLIQAINEGKILAETKVINN